MPSRLPTGAAAPAVVALLMLVPALGAASPAPRGDLRVTRVDRPPIDTRNRHYVGRRAPLARNPLIKLPLGAVRPEGWLREAMRRQVDGLTGHLDEISAWLQKEDNAWLDPEGRGRWGWEEVPYWLKGYIALGALLDDDDVRAEVEPWIEGAIASQRPNGDFGPVRHFEDDGSQDFWANMVMLDCLQAHYEITGDPRVPALMTQYFQYQLTVPDDVFLTHYWQHMRGGDNLASVYWLYDRTGDAFLLDLAAKIHHNTANWAQDAGLPNWHNVNIAQGFREPAQFAQQAHDVRLTEATYADFERARASYGQVPGGLFGADEFARRGYDDPHQGFETCGVVEHLLSDRILLCITGDAFWADHAEVVAFNQAPACFMPDYRALRYFVAPNQVTVDRADHHPGIANAGPFFSMNPLSHRCCQHNHSHMWTNVAQTIFTATQDQGLCALVYIPSSVTARVGDGTEVGVRLDTAYPFDDTVRFTITAPGPVAFPLMLRIPTWSRHTVVQVNGTPIAWPHNPGRYLRLHRTWTDGDVVTLRMPRDVELKRWPKNHDAASVHYGPLVFSVEIGQERSEHRAADAGAAVRDAKWQADVDLDAWPAIDLRPTTPWNYALVLEDGALADVRVDPYVAPRDGYPFSPAQAPVRVHVRARRVPEWDLDRFGLAGALQDSPVLTRAPSESISLIPMGAATLRLSMFPVAGDGPDAVTWTAPPEPRFAVRASHCWAGDWVGAVSDGAEPESSNDHSIPRLTFWDHRGTEEWVESTFDANRTVGAVEVYWFDDTGRGQCRVPAAWTLSYRDGDGAWRPVRTRGPFGVAPNTWNRVTFEPVTTRALRLDVSLQSGFSAGILEWRVRDSN